MNPSRLLLALLSLLRPPDMAANPSPLLSFCLRSSFPRAAASSPGPARRSPIGDALRRTAVDPRGRRGRATSPPGAGGGEDAVPESVAIVGGGLAGLSVAYHLVDGRSSRTEGRRKRLTVFDRCPVGEGGASSGEARRCSLLWLSVDVPSSSSHFLGLCLLSCFSCRWVSDGAPSSV